MVFYSAHPHFSKNSLTRLKHLRYAIAARAFDYLLLDMLYPWLAYQLRNINPAIRYAFDLGASWKASGVERWRFALAVIEFNQDANAVYFKCVCVHQAYR